MMAQTRVLHVLDHSLPVGSGYSYRSRGILLAQRRLGLEPVVLTSPKHGTARDTVETLDGICHYRTGRAGGALPVLRELALMLRLGARIARVARRERVTIIHAHSPVLNALPAIWAGRRLRIRTVYEVRTFWEDAAVSHGTSTEGSVRYRLSRRLETLALRRADAVVAICRGIQGDMIGRGIRPDRITLVPNGVDTEWFEARPRAAELAARLGIGTAPVFAYIGSFSHYEGLRFLVESAPGFLRSFPGARLLVVGGGRDEEGLRESARRAGPAVVMMGRVPQEQVRDLYTLINVLILPRRRLRLTELVTPLKPLEAMAVGTPVLASDIGGHTEMVTDGETGLLFKAESRDSLVEQAIRLAGDTDLRRHLIDNARRWVRSERTWERVARNYLAAYQEAG